MTIFKLAERIGKTPENAARLIQEKYRDYIYTTADGKLNLSDDLLKLPEFNIPLKGSRTVLQISEDMGISKQALQKRIAREPLKSMLEYYIYLYHGTKYISPMGIEIIQKSSDRRIPDFISDGNDFGSSVQNGNYEVNQNYAVKGTDYTQSIDRNEQSIDNSVDIPMYSIDKATDGYRQSNDRTASVQSTYIDGRRTSTDGRGISIEGIETSTYTDIHTDIDKSVDTTIERTQNIDTSIDTASVMNSNGDYTAPSSDVGSQGGKNIRETIDYAVRVMAEQLNQKDKLLLASHEENVALINSFTEQLKAKDSQIRALMEQNLSLSTQLSTEQALHAGTMSTRQLKAGEGTEDASQDIFDSRETFLSEDEGITDEPDNDNIEEIEFSDDADTVEEQDDSISKEIEYLKDRIEQLQKEKQNAQDENYKLKTRGFFSRLFNIGG